MASTRTIFDAVSSGDPARVKRALARRPAAIADRDEEGLTPLLRALYEGRAEVAALLLARGADIEARSRNSRLWSVTPLHSAAAGRQTAVALLLLEQGADPNAAQPGGWRPLHQAAATGDLELCKALLAKGAERMAMADERSRPLDFAIENGHRDVVSLLREGGPGRPS